MKPTLLNLETNEEFQCTGVPDALLRAQPVAWAQGAGAVRGDFLRTPPGTFVLDLSVEGFAPGLPPRDVRPQLAPLDAATKPSRGGRPPALLLTWGSINFPVVVEKVETAFTRFDPAGFPTSATVRVHLAEVVERNRIGQAVSGVMGAVTAPVRQLVSALGTAQQTVVRTARAFVSTARQQVDQARAAADRELAPVRQAVGDVQRGAKQAEREAKQLAREVEAHAKGVEAAGKQVVREAEARADELKQEAKRAEERVGEVKKEAEKAADDVKKSAEKLIDGVNADVGKQVERIEALRRQAAARTEEYKALFDTAVRDVENRTRALEAEVKGAAESRAEELRRQLSQLEADTKREVDDRLHTIERRAGEIAGFVTKARGQAEARIEELGTGLEQLLLAVTNRLEAQQGQLRAALWSEWQAMLAELEQAKRTADWDATRHELEDKLAELEARTKALNP